MEALQAEIISLVAMVIATLIGILTQKATAYLNKKGVVAKIQGEKELARIVVNAVEQSYKHLNGSEKLGVAKMDMVEMAKSKGIKVTEKDVDMLIESIVKEMKDGAKEGLK